MRPPADFRRLYGPTIRQTVLENYFVIKKKAEPIKTNVFRHVGKKRQKKITDFF